MVQNIKSWRKIGCHEAIASLGAAALILHHGLIGVQGKHLTTDSPETTGEGKIAGVRYLKGNHEAAKRWLGDLLGHQYLLDYFDGAHGPVGLTGES